MSDNIVEVKRLITLDDALDVIMRLNSCNVVENLVLDFSGLFFAKTLATALFARELRLLVRSRKAQGLDTYCRGCHGVDKSVPIAYLSYIGFFDFIGLNDLGEPVRTQAHVGGRNPYLAITKYGYKRFQVEAQYDPYRSESDYIQQEAEVIAKLLDKNHSNDGFVAYVIREIMRNSYEHSCSPYFYVMGQTWSDGSVELVIMDDGCGLLKTLTCKYPELKTERDAILEAMKPGVSGSDFSNNKYGNSGFGLYVLSEFAKRHGYICIVSGSELYRSSQVTAPFASVRDDGTFVGVHFDFIPSDCKSELAEIIKKGESIAMQSQYPIRPSKLTWDF